MTPAALLLAATLAAADATPTADWPQWRGPNRDGKSLDTGLTHPWPKDGPKLAWELTSLETVGTGFGQPAVVGDRLYLIGREAEDPNAKEFCACLSLADGKQVWKTPLESGPGKFPATGWGVAPRSTPTVVGDHLYVLGVVGDLLCLQKADGKTLWHKNLVKDFGGQIPQWGYSESPLIDGENLICTPGKGTGMVALNRMTGATVWACKDFADVAGYSSVIAADVGGVRQYVQQTMANSLAVRATDGKLIWKSSDLVKKEEPKTEEKKPGGRPGRGVGLRSVAVIPTPVVADGFAFFTAGYGFGCECFKLKPEGAEVVYARFKTLQNHHGGVIQVGDHVYGHSDAGGWTCFAFKQPKDEAVWQDAKIGKGSISYADGHLYCYAERDGTLARIKASPDGWQEAGRLKIPATSQTRTKEVKMGTGVWAHPVIAQGKLILRDYERLYCYDLKGK